ncbi:signal recognition particle protein Srp19 [Methanoplanus sp. FWC-SCC4]|uniref:Signal recognition particle 19 kDa protein n=1 Tax=Methanochimaera problematica TaxID=2609417 RepID=A0AA97FC53_9EURY|nr:signal recognition particle subunit SRP19/SEC65 family protein [Methanoplanus sp. FWC-SCC4]WOF15528.1 signal recognition particle protein Srp19 [Methanoplanus sp. FWC-SCC4]
MERETGKVLYPCYFDKDLKRKEGRRVEKTLAIKKPDTKSIAKAASKLALKYKTEDKTHPSFWIEKSGRVVVEWDQPKESLIKKIAETMKED